LPDRRRSGTFPYPMSSPGNAHYGEAAVSRETYPLAPCVRMSRPEHRLWGRVSRETSAPTTWLMQCTWRLISRLWLRFHGKPAPWHRSGGERDEATGSGAAFHGKRRGTLVGKFSSVAGPRTRVSTSAYRHGHRWRTELTSPRRERTGGTNGSRETSGKKAGTAEEAQTAFATQSRSAPIP